MSSQTVDRAYVNLLTHLQKPESSIPILTVLSAIPHYLTYFPLPHPTQLTAFVISSSLWHPLSVHNTRSLMTAYRTAVHLKESSLQKEADGWFSRGPRALLAEWISAVVKGVSRGDAQLRISIYGGLLLGLDDLGRDEVPKGVRESVERQVVIACAEVLEDILITGDAWKDEFSVRDLWGTEDANDTIFLSSAYHILRLVSDDKLAALDIVSLIRLTQKGVKYAFSSGDFLPQLSLSITRGPDGYVTISPESNLPVLLESMGQRTLYNDAGPLAKLLSRCLSLLGESTPFAAWGAFQDVVEDMKKITCKVERDWKYSLLAGLTSEQDIEPKTRELSTEIWKILKTLLFTQLLVSQSVLSSVPYLQPLPKSHTPEINSSMIARTILLSLYHLCFVLSQFGGVTSSAEGFKELKRVFYMALDIIAADADPRTCNIFIHELLSRIQETQLDSAHPFRQSQTAYVLAVIEQLAPVLDDSVIEKEVVPLCHTYLSDPKHRETYESAHSVMLSIFATLAAQNEGKQVTTRPTLAERLVPFYVDSLIKNSNENRLSTPQLRLAYSSLVRSATSSGGDPLAWLCIDALLVHIETSTSTASSRRPMHLYLTLISLISCVSLSLLPRTLAEIQKGLHSVNAKDKAELGKAVLEEITGKIGDREKEIALSWWCHLAPGFVIASQEEGA